MCESCIAIYTANTSPLSICHRTQHIPQCRHTRRIWTLHTSSKKKKKKENLIMKSTACWLTRVSVAGVEEAGRAGGAGGGRLPLPGASLWLKAAAPLVLRPAEQPSLSPSPSPSPSLSLSCSACTTIVPASVVWCVNVEWYPARKPHEAAPSRQHVCSDVREKAESVGSVKTCALPSWTRQGLSANLSEITSPRLTTWSDNSLLCRRTCSLPLANTTHSAQGLRLDAQAD